MVTLKQMTSKEFDTFLERAVQNYAEEKTEAGNWAPEEALENSKQDFQRLLPERENSADNYLYTIWDEEIEAGSIWLAKIGKEAGYIYDIYIDPAHQGKGYGKQAMLEIEEVAKDLGFNRIELHVFGHNQAARNLYEKLDYEITNLIMAKKLS
ncbi:GNAT family N-acetyltransferase [Bacillus salacetis]|uniref:GNAT family N-acetyltransferase n=1 Tax=Bacillus salacetis TaxID=2315464 RepID=UPI003BA2C30E